MNLIERLERVTGEAVAEIARLHSLSHMNAHSWDAMVVERDRFRAALEEIVNNGDRGIHVPGAYEIARKALASEAEK